MEKGHGALGMPLIAHEGHSKPLFICVGGEGKEVTPLEVWVCHVEHRVV